MKRNSKERLCGVIVKRRKGPKLQLCNLPMDILLRILSLLPVKDAIRTSVLSRKWKYVWCGCTNLIFSSFTLRRHCFKRSYIGYQIPSDQEFITSGVGVEHMEVKRGLHNKHADHVDRWVNFAIASRTKELILELSRGAKSSFVQRCITDGDVCNVLCKCNLLEFFEIAYCRMVTSIRKLHPSNQLKHLQVDNCPLLKEIELNCSPTTLEYTGHMIPLVIAPTFMLTNVRIKFSTYHTALYYITTGFPSTLPSLETMSLLCAERERAILPGTPLKFTYLQHLRLQLIILGYKKRKTDVLDCARLLEVAPFIGKLAACKFII